MKHIEGIEEIMSKIDEMRNFFQVGDEVIPFLGDLFVFIKDIMPLLTEINTSLKDSNGKLPTASDKISSATSTTEMATHEILDKLENISKILPGVQNGDGEKIIEVQNDINDIILALQFQDITSQELEHANRILDAINEKFFNLFDSIDQVKMSTRVGTQLVHAIENESNSEEMQKKARAFENKTEDLMRHNTGITQDDIDALFG